MRRFCWEWFWRVRAQRKGHLAETAIAATKVAVASGYDHNSWTDAAVSALACFGNIRTVRSGRTGLHTEQLGNAKKCTVLELHHFTMAPCRASASVVPPTLRLLPPHGNPFPGLSKDLTRVFDEIYPVHSVPDRIDDASLRPHAFASHLLERATVKLPSVRYRGFRVEPPTSSMPTTASTSQNAATITDSFEEESAAAWRFQQRREFMPFEERVRRVSTVQHQSTRTGTTAAAAAAPATVGNSAIAVGDHANGGVIPEYSPGAADTNTSTAAAKRFPVVLADYLGDTSTIGMAVVDQPGTGLTTALLSFLEWYCRGEAAGGRRVRKPYHTTTEYLGDKRL